jgi:DNA-binding response OmpR family regulator
VRKRILVVEDDIDFIELLKFNLAKAGFSIAVASDGAEGLKKARSLHPDLILLDLMIPELDGLRVCEILRREPATARLPIIFLTAMSSELGKMACLAAGANDFISKPFSPKNLLTRIQAALEGTAASCAVEAVKA